MDAASLVVAILALLTSAFAAWKAHQVGGPLIRLTCTPSFTAGYPTRLHFTARNAGRGSAQLEDLVLVGESGGQFVLPDFSFISTPSDRTLEGGSAGEWECELDSALTWWRASAQGNNLELRSDTPFDVCLLLGSGRLVRQSRPPTYGELTRYAAGDMPPLTP